MMIYRSFYSREEEWERTSEDTDFHMTSTLLDNQESPTTSATRAAIHHISDSVVKPVQFRGDAVVKPIQVRADSVVKFVQVRADSVVKPLQVRADSVVKPVQFRAD